MTWFFSTCISVVATISDCRSDEKQRIFSVYCSLLLNRGQIKHTHELSLNRMYAIELVKLYRVLCHGIVYMMQLRGSLILQMCAKNILSIFACFSMMSSLSLSLFPVKVESEAHKGLVNVGQGDEAVLCLDALLHPVKTEAGSPLQSPFY